MVKGFFTRGILLDLAKKTSGGKTDSRKVSGGPMEKRIDEHAAHADPARRTAETPTRGRTPSWLDLTVFIA
jgi:hypothetical protein